MALVPVTDREEVGQAFRALRENFRQGAMVFPDHLVGHRAATRRYDVSWHSGAGIWGLFEDRDDLDRYWICFGEQDPARHLSLMITVEINPPKAGINRRCAGVFLKDDGGTYISHSGRVGGGRPGIGMKAYREFVQDVHWHEMVWPDGRTQAVRTIARLDAVDLAARIAHFTHEVARFKDWAVSHARDESGIGATSPRPSAALGAGGATGGKYAPLNVYLMGLSKTEWRASFAEIENILGFALPKSARSHSAWWANARDGSHPHAAAWTAAGWQTSNVNLTGDTVWFSRSTVREAPRATSLEPSHSIQQRVQAPRSPQPREAVPTAEPPEDRLHAKQAADKIRTSNFQRITEGLEIVNRALAPFVGRELKAKYGVAWWKDAVLAVLREHQKHGLPTAGKDDELMHSLDLGRSLILVDQNWSYLFRTKLSRECRSWIKELMQTRNKWAHKGLQDMTDEDAWRALDTMIRIVQEIEGASTDRLRELARAVRFRT